MAYCKIHPIRTTLFSAINYITNIDKSEIKFINSNLCEPTTAWSQFEKTKIAHNKDNNIILAHHFMQSFKVGELDPVLANHIGNKLANKFFSDREYVLVTHTDKKHIHNHIIFNNVNFYTGKSYQSNINELNIIREYSDKLCLENNLSIIKNDKSKKIEREPWKKKDNDFRNYLKDYINKNIKASNSFNDFLNNMKKDFLVKKGKHISFKHKNSLTNKYIRSKSLGVFYKENIIKERINKSIEIDNSFDKLVIDDKNNFNSFLSKETKEEIKSVKVINKNDKKIFEKMKSSSGYDFFVSSHNLKAHSNITKLRAKYNAKGYTNLKNKIIIASQSVEDNREKLIKYRDEIISLNKAINNLNKLKLLKPIYNDIKNRNNYKEEIEEYKKLKNKISSYDDKITVELLIKEIKEKNKMFLEIKSKFDEEKNKLAILEEIQKNHNIYVKNAEAEKTIYTKSLLK